MNTTQLEDNIQPVNNDNDLQSIESPIETKQPCSIMQGWKTWAGVVLYIIYHTCITFAIIPPNDAIESLIQGLIVVGIGHKLDKLK